MIRLRAEDIRLALALAESRPGPHPADGASNSSRLMELSERSDGRLRWIARHKRVRITTQLEPVLEVEPEPWHAIVESWRLRGFQLLDGGNYTFRVDEGGRFVTEKPCSEAFALPLPTRNRVVPRIEDEPEVLDETVRVRVPLLRSILKELGRRASRTTALTDQVRVVEIREDGWLGAEDEVCRTLGKIQAAPGSLRLRTTEAKTLARWLRAVHLEAGLEWVRMAPANLGDGAAGYVIRDEGRRFEIALRRADPPMAPGAAEVVWEAARQAYGDPAPGGISVSRKALLGAVLLSGMKEAGLLLEVVHRDHVPAL